MRRDRKLRKEYHRDYMRQRRQGLTEGFNKTGDSGEGLTSYPDILDKLTDPVWRLKLEKICHAFQSSHRPSYTDMCWLGDNNLTTVCDWLECTT